jgi:hypothetical protein
MPDNEPVKSGDKKKRTPLESLRMDKTVVSVVSLHEADALDKAYWAAQSPRDRRIALEFMRQVLYGYDPISDRVEGVFEVIERPPR